MRELKEANGNRPLKPLVRKSISEALMRIGIGHIPKELPNNQDQLVRLYKLGTSVAELIESVVTPSEDNDRKVRDRISLKGPIIIFTANLDAKLIERHRR